MLTFLITALVLLVMVRIVIEPVITEWERGKKMFNYDLVKRFVSDYNLPIPVINGSYGLFHYYLRLHEEDFKALTKWNELVALIEKHFDSSPSRFLEEFYADRERVVQWFHDNPAQARFSKMDMNQFALPNRPNVTSKNIYNGNSVGGHFISIDLNKANYQAMKYVDPELVNNTDTYADFIRSFGFSKSMTSYIIDSKYFRQVIFGQSHPKRQITVETYLIYLVWKEWERLYGDNPNFELVSFSNDEFVIKLNYSVVDLTEMVRIADTFPVQAKSIGVDVKAKFFSVNQLNLLPKGKNCHAISFYGKTEKVYNETKTDIVDKPVELMCLPLNYRAVATKLMKGKRVSRKDYYFQYEKYKARICEKFKFVKGVGPFVPSLRKIKSSPC